MEYRWDGQSADWLRPDFGSLSGRLRERMMRDEAGKESSATVGRVCTVLGCSVLRILKVISLAVDTNGGFLSRYVTQSDLYSGRWLVF